MFSLVCFRKNAGLVAVLATLLASALAAQSEDFSYERFVRDLKPRSYQIKEGGVGPSIEVVTDKGIEQVSVARNTGRPQVDIPIEFEFNDSKVASWAAGYLENLAKALTSPELAGCKFALNGHTDTTGGAEYNRHLSLRRASAVRDFLLRIAPNIGRDRLVVRGFGKSSPIDQPGRDNHRSQKNRRVEVENLGLL